MKVQEYIITEDHVIWKGPQTRCTIPKGSFIKPISNRYVPKHVLKEYDYWSDDYMSTYTMCYTVYGIYPIPNSLIVEVR